MQLPQPLRRSVPAPAHRRRAFLCAEVGAVDLPTGEPALYWPPGLPDRERRVIGSVMVRANIGEMIFSTTHLYHNNEALLKQNSIELNEVSARNVEATGLRMPLAEGLSETSREGGRNDILMNVDGEKAGLWQGLFITLHGESRYGEAVLQDTGSILPANLALVLPQPTGTVTALTGVKFSQFLCEDMLVFAGKINTFDDFHQPLTAVYSQSGAGLVVASPPKEGSWSLGYKFDQAFYVAPDDPPKRWCVFETLASRMTIQVLFTGLQAVARLAQVRLLAIQKQDARDHDTSRQGGVVTRRGQRACR